MEAAQGSLRRQGEAELSPPPPSLSPSASMGLTEMGGDHPAAAWAPSTRLRPCQLTAPTGTPTATTPRLWWDPKLGATLLGLPPAAIPHPGIAGTARARG